MILAQKTSRPPRGRFPLQETFFLRGLGPTAIHLCDRRQERLPPHGGPTLQTFAMSRYCWGTGPTNMYLEPYPSALPRSMTALRLKSEQKQTSSLSQRTILIWFDNVRFYHRKLGSFQPSSRPWKPERGADLVLNATQPRRVALFESSSGVIDYSDVRNRTKTLLLIAGDLI